MSEHDDALRMIEVPVVLMEQEKIDAVLFAVKAPHGFGERFGWTDSLVVPATRKTREASFAFWSPPMSSNAIRAASAFQRGSAARGTAPSKNHFA